MLFPQSKNNKSFLKWEKVKLIEYASKIEYLYISAFMIPFQRRNNVILEGQNKR